MIVQMWRLGSRATSYVSIGRQLSRSSAGGIGLALVAPLILAFVVALFLHKDPNQIVIDQSLFGPGWGHPFGTDGYGRDELARFAAGGLQSLGAATLVLGVATAVALVLGTVAGLVGGAVDASIMRVVDVFLAIPGLVLALAVIGVFGPGFVNLVLALSIGYSAWFTRMSRAFALTSRQRDDVLAARLAGVSEPRVILGHIVPGVASRLWVVSTLAIGDIVVNIASLSFLGLGVQLPTAEWGSMLADSESYFRLAIWLLLVPCLAIVATAAAANLIADALQDADV